MPSCIERRQPVLPGRDRECLVCGFGRSPLDGRALPIPVLVDPFSQLLMAADRTGALRDRGATVSERARAAFALPRRTVAATDALGRGALAAAPIIDGDAYTFQLRTKNSAPTVKRLAVLPMRPGPQRGGRECF